MTDINRQWILKQRPTGDYSPDDFELRESAVPSEALKPGQILVQNMVFLCAPTMRNWMDPPGNSLYPSSPLGAPMMAPATCRVIASAADNFPVGTRLFTLSSWQDYQIMDINSGLPFIPLEDSLSYVEGMGQFGLNPLTAYFGLLRVGEPVAGETLVVSGAAGSTGSTAAQIGRIKGMRVIGIAGGSEKCAWLTDECRLDAAIDYKNEDVNARLGELCPQGINVFFDNVGGDVLQAAVEHMAAFGRIVLCGQIAGYNNDSPIEGPRNMMRLIYGSIRMQGFLCGNYAEEFSSAIADLKQWTDSGEIAYREDRRDGFELLPQTYAALFDGSNQGTLLAAINPAADSRS